MITANHDIKIRFGPSGYHFFNRKNGINLLVDEFRPPEELWSKAPRQVSVALTNLCDLSCSYCYAPKIPAELDFEKLMTWLIELDSNGCCGVGFGGGEPTLYPKFVKLLFFMTERTNLAVTMTTHAHRLSDQLLGDLAGNVHFIRVSMDGVGSTYESMRNRPFERLINRMAAIKKVVPFGVNFVVNSTTINDLDVAVTLASDLGASEFLLLPQEPTRNLPGVDNFTMNNLKKWILKYRGVLPLSISEGQAKELPVCKPIFDEAELMDFAHVDALGFLRKTSYDMSGVKIHNDGIVCLQTK